MRQFPTSRLLCLVPLVGFLTIPAWGAALSSSQWPQFRGPNSSGVADGATPPVEFSADTNLLWKTAVAKGFSSPCVWNDRIFLTAVEGDKLVTFCVNAGNGKVLWNQAVPVDKPREIHKKNSPAAATPATDGQRVCVYHATFGLLAYDFDGRELWRKPIVGVFARNGSGTSPAMLDGRLLLNCDVEEGKSFLAAFDPATGKEHWRTKRPEFASSYTTPVRWPHAGRSEVIVVGSLRVAAYDLNDGRERWTIAGTEAVSVASTPVLGEGMLYVMSRSFGGAKLPSFALFALGADKDGDGKISRDEVPGPMIEQGMFSGMDRNQDGFITASEWEEAIAFLNKADYGIFALKTPGEGELGTNHIAWKHRKGVASVSSPLFYRGRVYVVQDGGRVTCYDAKTGDKFMEQERIGAEGEYFASPVAADGKIYLCSTRGVVSVVEAGDPLKVLARNSLGEPIMATPAILKETIYVRSAAHLWAFARRSR
jgi:outer membrane protein assembly factor BamB